MSALPQPLREAALPGLPLYVRFADVDMMAIAHHSAYLHWFEQLRFHFLGAVLGLDHATLRREGIRYPLVACTVEYLKPVTFDTRPVGHVRLEYGKTSLLSFHYEIRDIEDDTLYAKGSTTHCSVDQALKLCVKAPALLLHAVAKAQGEFPGALCEGAPRRRRQKR